MLSSPPRDFPSGASGVECNLIVPGLHFRNTLYTLTGTRLVSRRLPRDHGKRSLRWRSISVFRSAEEPSSFSIRVRPGIPHSCSITRPKQWLIRGLSCSCKSHFMPLGAWRRQRNALHCRRNVRVYMCARVHTYVRLNNDDCSRMYACMYVLAMVDLCAPFVRFIACKKRDGLNLCLYNREILLIILVEF